MAAPDPFLGDAGTPGFFDYSYWMERAQNFHPSGGGTHSKTGADEALVGDIPFNAQYDAVRVFQGWDAVSTVAPYALLRSNPKPHPYWEYLYAQSVTAQPWKLDSSSVGQIISLGNSNPGNFFSGLKRLGATFGFFTGYNKTRLTVRYAPITWNLLEDSAIYGPDIFGGSPVYREWLRNCTFDYEPKLEALSLDSVMGFAEGVGNTAPISNPGSSGSPTTGMSPQPRGVQYQAPVIQLLVKPDLTITWRDVPSQYAELSTYYPSKILAGLGSVNLNDWYSFNGTAYASPFPAGTLLALGAHITRYPNPHMCPSRLVGYLAGQNAVESPYYLEIKLIFSYFNPPKGSNNNITITTNYGHNNFPWAGSRDANGYVLTGDTNAGKWFLATRAADPSRASSDPRLLPAYDFTQFWSNVNA